MAVYRLGSVAHPGISDLDRIAVVEAGDPVPAIWSQISPDARYLAMHGPFLVDLDTFRAHRWFSKLLGLELALGENVAFDEPSDPATCDLHLAAEGMVVLTLKLLSQARTGRVKVRSALCELHALRLSLGLAGLDAGAAPGAWGFADVVRMTRESWFATAQDAREGVIRDLLEQAPRALTDGLLALEHRLDPARAMPVGETDLAARPVAHGHARRLRRGCAGHGLRARRPAGAALGGGRPLAPARGAALAADARSPAGAAARRGPAGRDAARRGRPAPRASSRDEGLHALSRHEGPGLLDIGLGEAFT